MKLVPYKKDFFEEYFGMAKMLFRDYSTENLRKDLENAVRSKKQEAFFVREGNQLLGFVNVSVRSDYVEGATSSPVGYLEALYVKPQHRKKGIAASLCKVAEEWASARGCTQMGSDTWASNEESKTFHLKAGFREEDVLVHFIKDIDVS